jgi:hypothetical protein
MPIREINFGFFGSFQCRLATNPDDTNASPNGPSQTRDPSFPAFTRPGQGWTFDFDEALFDRVIRLSGPVSLRDGLVAPWKDAVVQGVKVDRGGGLLDAPGDPLVGQVVSLGQAVKFDSAAGGGPGLEALPGFELRAGTLLRSSPGTPPQIATSFSRPEASAWRQEYQTVKNQLAGSIANPARRQVLRFFFVGYSTFFMAMGTIERFVLPAPVLSATGGVLKEVADQTLPRPGRRADPGRWEIHIDFYRFDGDTLVGTVNGWVKAFFS